MKSGIRSTLWIQTCNDTLKGYLSIFRVTHVMIWFVRLDDSPELLLLVKRKQASIILKAFCYEKLKDRAKEDVHQFRPREEKYDGPGS